MPKYKFEVPAPLDSATTFSKVKQLLQGENDFRKFDPNVVLTFDEPSQSCDLKGKQFKANLMIKPSGPNSSVVSVEVDLPLALSLFKGKIQEAIEKNIKRIV